MASSVKTLLLSPPPLMGTSSSNSKLIILKSFIPRILTKAKTIIIQVAKNIHVVVYVIEDVSMNKSNYKNKNKKKLLKLGSLKKLMMMNNYSCCSSQSQIMPVPPLIKRLPIKKDQIHQYVCNYDSSWNTNLLSSSSSGNSSSSTCDDHSTVEDDDEAREGLSGYLNWLELGKKMAGKSSSSSSNDQKNKEYSGDDNNNEIDRLAEMFIAESYEKFRVEKEESYRRFHDMLARSL